MTTPYTGPEIEQAVKILREDALLEGNRAMAERMDRMEKRLERLPVSEMTPEEKAAAYDKLMAEKSKPPASPEPPKPDPNTPAAPPAKPPEPPKPPKRDPWFGDME